jgi:protein TonB
MKPVSRIMTVPLNFEDLLFSNKNREYGAFLLRKSYRRNLVISSITAMFVFSTITISQLFLKKAIVDSNNKSGKSATVTLDNPPEIEGQKDLPVIQVPPSGIKTIKFTVPQIVDAEIDDKLVENIPTVDDLLNVQPWTKTQDAETGGIDPTLDFSEPKTSAEPEPMTNILTWVPEMPHYPGGEEALAEYISSNIVYPELARKAGIQGKVITSFTIERSGNISNIKIEKGIGGGCDEEAIRVISAMGKWQPGKQNGNPVRVRMMIPISFKLQ